MASAKDAYSAITEMLSIAEENLSSAIDEKRSIASDVIEEYNEMASDELKFAKATNNMVSYTNVQAFVTHISSSSTMYDLCMQPLQCTACSLFIICCSAAHM
jgi:aconitase A